MASMDVFAVVPGEDKAPTVFVPIIQKAACYGGFLMKGVKMEYRRKATT